MRVNISVPDDLHDAAKALDLPVSAICQAALRQAVASATGGKDEALRAAIAQMESLLAQAKALL